jgi:predicted AAA+ superfamily ATPase
VAQEYILGGMELSPLRDSVRQLREKDSEVTASAMARELGVSRERVRQVLLALGLPTQTSRSTFVNRAPRTPLPPPGSIEFAANCNHVMRGAWAELLVASDLLRRGYEVFTAVGASSCDLLALRNTTALRVEVKLGQWINNSPTYFASKVCAEKRGNFDLLAVVSPDGKQIRYDPQL